MTDTALRTRPKDTPGTNSPKRGSARQFGGFRERSRFAKVLLNVLQRTWLIAVVFAIWWIASANSTNIFIPSLEDILLSLRRDLSNGVIGSGGKLQPDQLGRGASAGCGGRHRGRAGSR